MRITLNGQREEVPEQISVAQLLEQMSLEPRRVAVELNRQLIPRAQHAETKLADRDELEIVTLVGGG
ncbi:MAG: sulfur carrier protein ThiS [Planctomycetota bacterium]|jgi:sulfur carrier protein